jgi:hypothetical protein
MTTEKQLSANRQNAQKSTGPRSADGKKRAARNACKPRLLTHRLVHPENADEDPDDFKQLLNDLRHDFRPAGTHENLLIERLAACYWRLRRAAGFENRSITESTRTQRNPLNRYARQIIGQCEDPEPPVLPRDIDFKRLVQYEALIDRQIHRILAQLRRCRSAPPDAESDCPEKNQFDRSPADDAENPAPPPAKNF